MGRYEEHEAEDRAASLVTRMFHSMVGSQCGDLTMRQMAILLECSNQPIGISELSDKIGIPKSSVSRSCDYLEKNGLVRRQRLMSEDSRRVTIEPTPQGLAMVGKAICCVASAIN